nr:hypothetical protein [Oscillibacter sp.]
MNEILFLLFGEGFDAVFQTRRCRSAVRFPRGRKADGTAGRSVFRAAGKTSPVLGETTGKVSGDAGIKAAVPAAQYVGVVRRSSRPLAIFRNSIPQLSKNAQRFDIWQLQANFSQGNGPFKNVAKSIAWCENVCYTALKALNGKKWRRIK